MADLGAYNENVRFSASDAHALISACHAAAGAIDGQKGSMQAARSRGEEQFRGYFSTLFASNGATQVRDAGELAGALRAVATLAVELQKAADAEQQRRLTARKWVEDQKHQSVLSSAVGWVEHNVLGQSDTPPVGPPAPPLNPVAPKPAVGERQSPHPGSGGGASSGTSSAIPDNLTSFASTTGANDAVLASQHAAVQKAYTAFTSSCGWGTLDANGVLAAFQQFISGNRQEAAWAGVVAAAFERAGGAGSVCTLSNPAIVAALAAAHVSASRQDLTISMPTVKGGLVTSGYADDPVNTATGNFIEPETDLGFEGACSALVFSRMYNSVDPAPGAFGPGWSSWTETRLSLGEDSAHWVQPDGRHVVFPRTEDGWGRATGSSHWLEQSGEGLAVSDNSGGVWRFTTSGRLESFARGEGSRVDARYGADGRLVGLVHERERTVTLEWNSSRVTAIVASDGRRVVYDYDDADRLLAVSGPSGVRRYVWGVESGLIEQVVDGDGVTLLVNGYDDQGRVAWQRSPFGRTSRYSYLPGGVTEVADTDGERSNTWIADPQGRLIGVIDSEGNRQSYAWDPFGGMVAATDRAGRRTVREYDDRGRLIRHLTPDGADLQYGYDDSDRVIAVVAGSADGSTPDSVTGYEYEGGQRNPSAVIDPEGGRTLMAWERGVLSQLTDPTGVVLRFGYDAHGDLISTTNADGDVARLERDDAGRLVAAVTPSGHRTTYSYDDTGRLVARQDADGGVWRFEHTAAGRLSAQIAPDGGRTAFEYGAEGVESRIVDPLGRVTTRKVDDLGNLAELRLPDGSTWSYTHDALSRLVTTVDPTGGVWQNRYDTDGTRTAAFDPTGVANGVALDVADKAVTFDDGLLATTVRLDALGRPRDVASDGEDPLTCVYDLCGRVVEILDGEGALTAIRRDAAGRPVEVTDPTGATTRYVYDACGRLAEVIGADGGVTTREYDADSLLVRQTLPNGDAAWAKYDACGRLVQVHQPGSGTATYTFDKTGRVTSAVDSWWGSRRFAYDVAGQLTSVTNGLGAVTRFEYDDNGRLVRTIDPTGGVTSQSWDGMDRLVSTTDALGRTTTAGYDAAGRPLWQQDAAGHRLSFTYDASGRVVTTSADGRVIGANAYDPARRRVTIDDRTGEVPVSHLKEWDRQGRLTRHLRSSGADTPRGLAWSYDRAGRRTSMVDAFGRTTRYRYDAAGRLEQVEHPVLGTVVLTHDAAGQLTAAVTTEPSGGITRHSWTWADGMITAHTTAGTGGGSTTEIDRDEDGRIRSITRDGAVTRYGYDLAEQLTEVVSEGVSQSWAFDPGGRVAWQARDGVRESYAYDRSGQLVEVQHGDGTSTAHQYDPSGARIRTVEPDGATLEYEWRTTGWLSRMTLTGQDGSIVATELRVDALGQLAQAGSNALWWDSASAIPALVGVGETPVLTIGPVTGVGGRWQSAGWRDTRRDTMNPWLVDSVAPLPDGFGLTANGTLALDRPGGLAPLEWLGARPYDPSTYAFLATDPVPPVIGAGWAANPYSYAGNNPLAFSDPTGLHPLTDAQLRAQTQGWLSQAWDASTNWVSHNWEYLAAGAAIVGGIALMCTGVGGPAGIALMAGAGALIAGGADTAIQKFTTGTVDWGQVGVTMVIGAATGGAGAWAAGLSAGANGATALAYSVGLNGVIGGAGSEASYLAMNHSHLTWRGAAGAFAGGTFAGAVSGGAGPAGGTIARNLLADGTRGATTGVTARLFTAGINAAGGTGGDIVNQVVASPGQPINWTHVATAGTLAGGTSMATSYASSVPGAEHVLPPDPRGMNSLEQASHFGVRSNDGVLNFAGRNTKALWGGALIGSTVAGAESPGIDKAAEWFK